MNVNNSLTETDNNKNARTVAEAMLLPLFVLTVGIVNLALGLWLLISTQTLSVVSIVLLSVGSVASVILSIICIVRPKSFMQWPGFAKKLCIRRNSADASANYETTNTLNSENAEIILKNLRGIPYLIQVKSKQSLLIL